MNKTRVALRGLGFVLGGGSLSSYALAGHVTSSGEPQESLTVLIVPAVALVGGLTVAALLAWLATRPGPLLARSAPGWCVSMGVLALGHWWNHKGRTGTVTSRDESSRRFANVSLGSDVRRNTRIGELEPRATSAPVTVGLGLASTFDGLEWRAGDGSMRHRLPKAQSSALTDGEHAWVVGGEGGALTGGFH